MALPDVSFNGRVGPGLRRETTLLAVFSRTRPMHLAALPAAALLAACRETRTRRSGPGGQNRNKVETAVVLTHVPTGLVAEAAERRSLAENRRVALARLRLALAIGTRQPPEADGPTMLWRCRTRGRRLIIAASHDDYPALLAEALDRLKASGWRVTPAAEPLGVSATQLAGLIRKSKAAWTALNERRAAAGLRRLS